jgi:hypothetical protein
LESYLEKTLNYDRWLNMFLAVMANGSIASWVVWKEYSFIWGLLIALSQLINAIKVYLPYQKRLKNLESITKELETLFLGDFRRIFYPLKVEFSQSSKRLDSSNG